MTATVRSITPDELTAWFDALQVGFNERTAPSSEIAEFRRPFTEFERTLAAFDGDRIAGTFRSFATQLTAPGGCLVPADAITAVTVLPTHRRQGLLRAMMARDLRSAADRGDPLAILIASEWPIYGRYGFGPACDHATLTLERNRMSFARPAPGTVALVSVAELREVAPAIYDRVRSVQPGFLERTPRWWDIELDIAHAPGRKKWEGWQVVSRDEADEPAGYLRYHVEEKWEGHDARSILHVDELIAASPGAYARLWRFVAEADLIGTIRAESRPLNEPLRWLLADGQAAQQIERAHMLWIRILDPAAALASRRYAVQGRVVLDVLDRDGVAGGTFVVEGGPDGAICRPTEAGADVRLPVAALGSIFLGGVNLGQLAEAGLVEEARPGGIWRVESMFHSPVEPWCSTWF